MADRPPSTRHWHRLLGFALAATCVILRASGHLDDAALATGCTVAALLGR